jgi:hypothetical protein
LVKSTNYEASKHEVFSILLLLLLSQTHTDILLTNTSNLQIIPENTGNIKTALHTGERKKHLQITYARFVVIILLLLLLIIIIIIILL